MFSRSIADAARKNAWRLHFFESSPHRNSEFAIRAKRLLILDDDQDILDVLAELLKRNYRVHATTDARGALNRRECENSDLILVDLMMPEMDGQSFIKELRHRGLSVPVVVMTANHEVPKNLKALGVKSLIRKPFHIEEVEEKIQRELPGEV